MSTNKKNIVVIGKNFDDLKGTKLQLLKTTQYSHKIKCKEGFVDTIEPVEIVFEYKRRNDDQPTTINFIFSSNPSIWPSHIYQSSDILIRLPKNNDYHILHQPELIEGEIYNKDDALPFIEEKVDGFLFTVNNLDNESKPKTSLQLENEIRELIPKLLGIEYPSFLFLLVRNCTKEKGFEINDDLLHSFHCGTAVPNTDSLELVNKNIDNFCYEMIFHLTKSPTFKKLVKTVKWKLELYQKKCLMNAKDIKMEEYGRIYNMLHEINKLFNTQKHDPNWY